MRRRLLVLLACVVVLASGCLRAEVDLEVRGDGSGELRVLEAVDESALARLDVESPGDVVLVPTDLPAGVSAKPYRRGGFVGTELRTGFDDLTELAVRVAEVGDVLAGLVDASDPDRSRQGGLYPSLDQFTVGRTTTGWYFESAAVLPAIADLPAAGGAPGVRLEVQVTVELPGRAVSHNADRADGGRFAWNLSPGDGRDRLVAETTTVGQDGVPWGLLALGLGLVALAGGVGWFLLDDRRRPGTNGKVEVPIDPAGSPGAGLVRGPGAGLVRGPGAGHEGAGGWPARPPVGYGWSLPAPGGHAGAPPVAPGAPGAAPGPPGPPGAPPGAADDAPPAVWPSAPPASPPVLAGPGVEAAPEAGPRPPRPGSPPPRPPDLPPDPG
ncbi:MAG: hypothetical protein GEV08_12000 [Acidimicrobiia bacterium]|nr:hypothetical protein [Acidimicrobiia bacterium]